METTKLLAILALIFSFIFPLIGIILAIIVLVQIHKNSGLEGKGLAIAALVVSIVISIICVLSILLAANFVLQWGNYYGKKISDDIKSSSDVELTCNQNVGIDWVSIGGVTQKCHGGEGSAGFIYFMMKNTDTTDIESLGINVIGSFDVLSNNSIEGTSIDIGMILRKNITYNYDVYGSIIKMELVPEVKVGGVLVACKSKALSISSNELREC